MNRLASFMSYFNFLLSSFQYDFFNILFTEINSLLLLHQPIKVLEIETSMLFRLAFANNRLSCFFFFSIIIDFLLYFSI